MSVIVTVNGARLHLLVPGATPAAGLRSALAAISDALGQFPSKPGAGTLAASLCGVAWLRHTQLLRILPTPAPTERTSHLLTLDVGATPTISISTVIFDEEDETFGQLHEGTFVASSILSDPETLISALTVTSHA